MTVRYTVATSTATETGTESSTLDLGLDSIILLKRQGKFSVTNIVSPSSFCGRLESSPREGERWLRTPAQDDSLYTMEKLGRRLLIGYALPKSVEDGAFSDQYPTQHIPNIWTRCSADLQNSWLLQPVFQN